MDLLALLRSQNRCLQKFVQSSEQNLELLRLGQELPYDQFQKYRDTLLKTLQFFSKKISEKVLQLKGQALSPDVQSQVKLLLNQRDENLTRVRTLDQEIFTLMESKLNVIRTEISAVHRSKQLLSRFKSIRQHQNGEGLDNKL